MSSFPIGLGVAREKVEAAAKRSRQFADACYAAWGSMNTGNGAMTRTANVIMDCSYIASGTARLLSHSDEYQLHALAMQVAVCRRLAKRIAQLSAEPNAIVADCARAARHAIESYDDLLNLLWETSRVRPPTVGDRLDELVEPDADESVA